MTQDRITQIRVQGMRACADVTLDLNGLTVLIGENGAGKSTILEALEILRKGMLTPNFIGDVITLAHGGSSSLLRHGSELVVISVKIEAPELPSLTYLVGLAISGVGVSSPLEVIRQNDGTASIIVFERIGEKISLDNSDPNLTDWKPVVKAVGAHHPGLTPQMFQRSGTTAFHRIKSALESISIHVPFDTRPIWQQRELGINSGPRWPSPLLETTKVDRYASNLPNVYQHLRNLGDTVWKRVLDRAKLGLGEKFRDFRMPAVGRGNIDLEAVFAPNLDKPLPISALSEGQVSYLAFVALAELSGNSSVLAFDEPELHLHPSLLTRVVAMLEESAKTTPVILATHSDRLLDALSEPAKSVVLCELDENRAMTLARPNAEKLRDWLEDFRGIGSLRAEGYDRLIFERVEPSPAEDLK